MSRLRNVADREALTTAFVGILRIWLVARGLQINHHEGYSFIIMF
jgi:hypothetical protein